MAEPRSRPAWLRVPGADGEAIAARLRERVEERIARGVVTAEEIEEVAAARLEVFDEGDLASEAFRRCCVTAAVDRPAVITSHRAVVGPILVAAKRALARLLRFQNEAALARQREFNENVLRVLRELLRRSSEREGR